MREAREEMRTGEERRKHDTDECGKILRALHLEEEGIDSIKLCRRIGEVGQDPWPLVVVLRLEETKRKLLEAARDLRGTELQDVGIVPDLTLQQRKEEQQMVEEVERRNEEDLTAEDRAKNLQWMLVGPKGAKKIIKGIQREQRTWRGTMRRGRGQITTGANAAPLRGGAALRGMGGRGAARIESVRLLPSMDRTRLASKRNREEATAEEATAEEGEEEEAMESAEEDIGEERSPPRKK